MNISTEMLPVVSSIIKDCRQCNIESINTASPTAYYRYSRHEHTYFH